MIQLKTPYTHFERAVAKTGTLVIEIASWTVLKDAVIYNIEDFIVDENNAKQLINSRTKRVENAEINQLNQLIEMDNDFSAMPKTERDWVMAKIGLLIFVQNDLTNGVNTIYNKLPNDWEFSN